MSSVLCCKASGTCISGRARPQQRCALRVMAIATKPNRPSAVVSATHTLDRPQQTSAAQQLSVSIPPPLSPDIHSPNGQAVFFCPEESLFYAQAIEKLVLSRLATGARPYGLYECGAGDGSPVLAALTRCPPLPATIHGYELSPEAAEVARESIHRLKLDQYYRVHHKCFFKAIAEGAAGPAMRDSWLIANPPYLPAPDNDITMPLLYGGQDGGELTRDLLSLGFGTAMLLISAYSNPRAVLAHARACGYQVADFMVTPLPFGQYSSEPKVRNWINLMQSRGEAFFSPNCYLLAAVVFQKTPLAQHAGDGSHGYAITNDVTEELLTLLTAL